ncbi:MAG TPA: Hsp20/alpha crystallin family protein [Methanomassiliicoccales archaeon]|jgi:HSP20 family protein|nr:Hsp20/alpha crystallin family protein [Methanomassiliicoccales archaeon]
MAEDKEGKEEKKEKQEVSAYRPYGPWFWRPWGPSSMMREMERIMDELEVPGWRPVYSAISRYPAIDVKDEGDKYVVKADLPGIGKEDVNVTIGEGVLDISAKRENKVEEEREGFIRRERGYINYSRRLVLPEDASEEDVDAGMNEGVLTLTIMKKKLPEQEKKKKVEVK